MQFVAGFGVSLQCLLPIRTVPFLRPCPSDNNAIHETLVAGVVPRAPYWAVVL